MEGNQMKMHEAMSKIYILVTSDSPADEVEIANICFQALSSPPRNCDVGTAEEQAERMRLYCNSHGVDESGCFRCERCQFLTVDKCELAWAQMPYEKQEGGEK